MSVNSPSASRILTAATAHFAQRGYDGSSLAEIAAAAGMRKASLYAHFKNKEMLFMQSYMQSRAQELALLPAEFTDTTTLPGMYYCQQLIKRYTQSASLQLFLRTSYMPPAAITPQIDAAHEEYLALLHNHFISRLHQTIPASTSATIYAEAYLGIVDSIQVKLIYTDEAQATQRLHALQHLMHICLTQ